MNRGWQNKPPPFGTTDEPFADIDDHIRIVPGTTISNRKCDYIVKLEDAVNYLTPEQFNVLYPHWGYDLELYPRPDETIALANQFITQFDAIIGLWIGRFLYLGRIRTLFLRNGDEVGNRSKCIWQVASWSS